MSTSRKITRVFIDESGTPDEYREGVHLKHDKYFTIVAVIISQPNYKSYQTAFKNLRKKYDLYLKDQEIKSYYIRCSNPSHIKSTEKPKYEFHKHPNGQEIYNTFCQDLKSLIKTTKFKVISVTTNKEVAGNMHPREHIHKTLLSDLWERLSIYHLLNNCPKMKIIFDPTKGNADKIMKESYQKFQSEGTKFFHKQKLADLKLEKHIHLCDSEDSDGLQLADICAHPIKSQIERGNHLFFVEHVQPKLHVNVHDKETKNTVTMGTKVCLNRPRNENLPPRGGKLPLIITHTFKYILMFINRLF